MNKPIEIRVPEGSTVRNYLYENMDVDELNQDLLLIVLPSGICIDVGWFPENDPDGHFYLRVFQGREEISGWELKSLAAVVSRIERIVSLNQYERPISQTARSKTVTLKPYCV